MEVNTPAKDYWYIPFIHTIVFFVHPLVENICVHNPTSMNLEHKTHQNKYLIKNSDVEE